MAYEDQILDPLTNDGDEEAPETDVEEVKSDDDEVEEFSDADL